MKTAEVLRHVGVRVALCLFSGLPQSSEAKALIHFRQADLKATARELLDRSDPISTHMPALTTPNAWDAGAADSASSPKMESGYGPSQDSEVRQYVLTILCGEGGTVSTDVVSATSSRTLSGAGTFSLDNGVEVTATAAARAGWRFTSWTGTMSSRESTLTFTMTSDQRLEAHFAQKMPELIVTCGEGGSVTQPGVGSLTYESGMTIPIEAEANPGYRFAGWTGTVVDRRDIIDPKLRGTSIVLNENGTLCATFEAVRSFHESWETATAGFYAPAEAMFIHADEGTWSLEDTTAGPCPYGPAAQRAVVVKLDSGQALLLTSTDRRSMCSDMASVSLMEAGLVNPGFALAIDTNTVLSFYEVGRLDGPGLHNPSRDCATPPCFDNVSLLLSDNKGNVLAYVLQRSPGATANTPNAHLGDTYREIFLDPSGIWYQRNLLSDLRTIPAFDVRDAQVRSIEFRVDEHGSALIDDVTIGSGSIDGTVPVYRFWSPVLESHFFTAGAEEKQNLIDLYSAVWTFEGIAYSALADGLRPGALPVYRFWSSALPSHLYTISETEKDVLVRRYSDVWMLDGIAFYAYPEGHQPADACPVYRFWSGTLSCHFYTASEKERDNLITSFPHVWTLEGIAWYAYPPRWDSGQALAIVRDNRLPGTGK